jgi:hypothetical protein
MLISYAIKQLQIRQQEETCTEMFIAISHIIAKIWK